MSGAIGSILVARGTSAGVWSAKNFGQISITFESGVIGSLTILGRVDRSIIAAGLDPVDGIFKNGNDVIAGGTASQINSLTVKGCISSDSYIRTGLFPRTVTLKGLTFTFPSAPAEREGAAAIIDTLLERGLLGC